MTDNSKFIAEAREALKLFGIPVWAATDAQTDAAHIGDYAKTLEISRESHGLGDETEMHSLHMLNENGHSVMTCVTGNTPNAPARAKALGGFLHSMPQMLDILEASDSKDARITELLVSNNDKLFDLREAKARIKSLEGTVAFLMAKIPDVHLQPSSDAA